MNKTRIERDDACATCCYYREQDHGIGSCHRYPPTYAGEQTARELHGWRFPLVSPSSWCGEHRLRETSLPESGRP